MSDYGGEDALVAVLAHGLIAPACSVHLAIATVRSHLDDLDTSTMHEILERAEERARFVIDSLYDLVRGLPPEVQQALAGGA